MEEVRHPSHVWVDPDNANLSLHELVREYTVHLTGRSQPVSSETVDKYRKAIQMYVRSIERQQQLLVLASVTPATANAWIQEQRDAGKIEDGIASRLGAVKVFTNKFIYKHAELTTRDLLAKVPRITPPERPAVVLTEEEIEHVLDCFDRPTFEDVRNRALVACYIATGLRMKEVLELPYDSLNKRSGEITGIRAKGNKPREARLAERALKHVREYLKLRPSTAMDERLWICADGTPLTYWGVHSIMRRLRVKSGIVRMHWHLFRHGFAQHALKAGADIGTVQEMLGHSSNTQTRRYAGQVSRSEAARKMPQFSPI
jgi:site-specific recombinase XerD